MRTYIDMVARVHVKSRGGREVFDGGKESQERINKKKETQQIGMPT